MYIVGVVMQVAKWGNSLAVRLPKKLVDDMSLHAGDTVEIVQTGKGRLEIGKADQRAAFLDRMKKYDWAVPPGYKFDRDEANER